jgi:serine/threonine protein kinase
MLKTRYEQNKNLEKCIKFTEDKLLPQINQGGQSRIFKLEQQNCGIAIVKIYKDTINIDEIKNEIENLKLVKSLLINNCPNIIYLYDYSYEKKYILIEYCDGDLETLFLKNELEQNVLKSILFQILCGIYGLQTIGIIHYDLKYRNIFYKYITDEYIYYKINNVLYKIKTYGYLILIADFGLSKHINTDIKNIINEYYYLPLSNHNLLLIKYSILDNNINLDKYVISNKKIYYDKLKNKIFTKNTTYKKKISELFYTSFENNYIDYKLIYNDLYEDIIKKKYYIKWLDKYNDFISKIFVKLMFIPDILYNNFTPFIYNNNNQEKIYIL